MKSKREKLTRLFFLIDIWSLFPNFMKRQNHRSILRMKITPCTLTAILLIGGSEGERERQRGRGRLADWLWLLNIYAIQGATTMTSQVMSNLLSGWWNGKCQKFVTFVVDSLLMFKDFVISTISKFCSQAILEIHPWIANYHGRLVHNEFFSRA